MTFLSGAAVLLLRGLVISAVLGLESSYTSQLSNRVTPDPAAVAPTGKTRRYYLCILLTNLKSDQPAQFCLLQTLIDTHMIDCHCCFNVS